MSKNTFGNALKVTIFGESHGEAVGAVVDGISPGIPVEETYINHQLTLRRPYGRISTSRQEADPWRIVSGVFNGKTTGTPLCLIIANGDTKSGDYTPGVARPGHADYTAQCKYHGFQDYRGGGHFSGRITAALVAVGGILLPALRRKNIEIGTHLSHCAGYRDIPLDGAAYGEDAVLREQIRTLNERIFPVLDQQAGEHMMAAIDDAKGCSDSVGGLLESAIVGLPVGLGEPWFDSMESQLSHALFSIPAVKGVEFGSGFAVSELRGSMANDPLCMKDGRVVSTTNHNGGINGGISNGMPLVFRCAIKPTPSISKKQQTVDFCKQCDAAVEVAGRHDPCVAHRARVVVDSMAAIVVADTLLQRDGNDALI